MTELQHATSRVTRIDELADVLKVLHAIAALHHLTWQESSYEPSANASLGNTISATSPATPSEDDATTATPTLFAPPSASN